MSHNALMRELYFSRLEEDASYLPDSLYLMSSLDLYVFLSLAFTE